MRGYVVGLQISGASGLALVSIADEPRGGVAHQKYIESGFGVRQLVDAFGTWEEFVRRAPETPLEITMADDGMVISSFTLEEEVG